LFKPIEWLKDDKVRFLDQTRLPQDEVWISTDNYRVIELAIRGLQVRGAPLIGIAAAYGLALASLSIRETRTDRFRLQLQEAADRLASTRPTAVNLTWALKRMLGGADRAVTIDELRRVLVDEAKRIHEEDVAANLRIGAAGAELLPEESMVLTHCNAGSLATGGYGTALGVIRSAFAANRLERVFATETRPLVQGARLTAWELAQEGIPFTIVVDAAAGSLLRRGFVTAVVVGADRIAANGDVANKIGTYQIAVLARENGVPFYVAAPTSTIDLSLPSGDDIPIEERSPDEVTSVRGVPITQDATTVLNPAFDVTPGTYLTAIITENGVVRPPFTQGLRNACEVEAAVSG
jgi:methylthioribose-1-phosphate isomerase